MTDGGIIHCLVGKKMSLSTFFEQILVGLNLKYLCRILRSENGRLTTSPQHPIPAFCSDHTRTRSLGKLCAVLAKASAKIFFPSTLRRTSACVHCMGVTALTKLSIMWPANIAPRPTPATSYGSVGFLANIDCKNSAFSSCVSIPHGLKVPKRNNKPPPSTIKHAAAISRGFWEAVTGYTPSRRLRGHMWSAHDSDVVGTEVKECMTGYPYNVTFVCWPNLPV